MRTFKILERINFFGFVSIFPQLKLRVNLNEITRESTISVVGLKH